RGAPSLELLPRLLRRIDALLPHQVGEPVEEDLLVGGAIGAVLVDDLDEVGEELCAHESPRPDSDVRALAIGQPVVLQDLVDRLRFERLQLGSRKDVLIDQNGAAFGVEGADVRLADVAPVEEVQRAATFELNRRAAAEVFEMSRVEGPTMVEARVAGVAGGRR